MENVSAAGAFLQIIAVPTFPVGFTIERFPDDADGMDTPNQTIANTAIGVNGHMVYWNIANINELSVSVLPGTPDAENLMMLWDANRTGGGKFAANDIITAIESIPGRKDRMYLNGKLVSGPPANSISSSGRQKSLTFTFHFESVSNG